MRKTDLSLWMLILTLRLISAIFYCLDFAMTRLAFLRPQQSRLTTIRHIRRAIRTGSSETNSYASINPSGASSIQYRISHQDDYSLTLHIYDTHTNHTWIYRFDSMSEYTDCLLTYLRGATHFDKAPEVFLCRKEDDATNPQIRR